MRNVAIILCAAALAAQTPCFADGIGSLVEAGQAMDEAKRAADQEASSFDRAKAALNSGALSKGLSKSAVLAQCGDPIVMNEDYVTKRERWVYKHPSSSFFKGARINIFFDAQGAVDEVKVIE